MQPISPKIANQFIQLTSVDSTNNYALDLIKKGKAENGTAILASYQSKGRGQMGKNWQANANDNILTSIIVDISTIHIQNQFFLLAAVAIGCKNFIQKFTTKKTAIKWSNDIYIEDNKAAGILIETANFNKNRFAVIGIGVNVNQENFDEIGIKATSLKIENNQFYAIDKIIQLLYAEIELMLVHLFSQNNKFLLELYNEHLYKKNENVVLKKNNIRISATIVGVNSFGELLVENCIYNKFSFGEVKWN